MPLTQCCPHRARGPVKPLKMLKHWGRSLKRSPEPLPSNKLSKPSKSVYIPIFFFKERNPPGPSKTYLKYRRYSNVDTPGHALSKGTADKQPRMELLQRTPMLYKCRFGLLLCNPDPNSVIGAQISSWITTAIIQGRSNGESDSWKF